MAYGDRFDPGDDLMPTHQQLAEHRAAEIDSHRVPCRDCGAKAQQPCINKYTKQPLRKYGAHQKRITDAKNKPANADDDFEVPF